MNKVSCHCGNITISIPDVETVTSCNCSLCYRLGSLWAYFQPSEVEVKSNNSQVEVYCHGDKYMNFHRCGVCGCTTHYTMTEKAEREKIAVNIRMADKELMNHVHIRYFDGADSWTYLNE